MSIKNSRPVPAEPMMPGTGPGAARDRVIRLRQDGGNYRGIAAAGLASGTVQGLLPSRCRPVSGAAAAAVAVTPWSMPRGQVDAGGIRLRLRALHVMGHGSARIARAVGVHPTTIRALVRGDTATTSTQLRDAITAVYEAWWDKRAPGRTRFERGAATAARKRAIAGNWCAAAALDDDLLDIPGYQPSWGWKPATGTGTAPDIYPPVLQQKKERHMADDERFTWGFIHEVLDVLERHGYRRSDSEHTAQAIGLIHHVARIYEGALDAPRRYVEVPSSPLTAPQLPLPEAAALTLDNQAKTLLAALDDAAEYKRDRAETCADCAGQSCTSCQRRLQTAGAYDQLAEHMTQAAEASATRPRAPGHPAPGTGGPHPAEKEAGQ